MSNSLPRQSLSPVIEVVPERRSRATFSFMGKVSEDAKEPQHQQQQQHRRDTFSASGGRVSEVSTRFGVLESVFQNFGDENVNYGVNEAPACVESQENIIQGRNSESSGSSFGDVNMKSSGSTFTDLKGPNGTRGRDSRLMNDSESHLSVFTK